MLWLWNPSGGLEKVADGLQWDTEAVTCLPLPAGLGALPACGSRVVFVQVQLTLERVEGLPGGIPACSTRMGEFCACDRHRLVSKIFALLVITMSWGPPAVTQNYSSHAAQNSPHRALATVLPEWAPAHLLLFCRTWEQEGISLHLALGPSTFVLCINS